MSAWNARYEAKFGHIFIICATGRPASEVLAALRARYPSPPHDELRAASAEQAKITALRLDKLLASLAAGGVPASAERRTGAIEAHVVAVTPAAAGAPAGARRPPITTHVLDMARGGPAAGVPVVLEMHSAGSWGRLGGGGTDADGRCATLLPTTHALAAGQYRLTFDTGAYHDACGGAPGGAFYPNACIAFRVAPHQTAQHFHVPLLLAPFGYSTYRGS